MKNTGTTGEYFLLWQSVPQYLERKKEEQTATNLIDAPGSRRSATSSGRH
jgi:hypothetical protein